MKTLIGMITATVLAAPALAQDREVLLYAPGILVESGLMKHILPRFSLKTQVRVQLVPEAQAEMVLGEIGRAVMSGPVGSDAEQSWHLEVRLEDADTKRLADWLRSDVGQRTIQGFAPEGVALFGPPQETGPVVAELAYDGDAEAGHKVSLAKCTRCHAVDDATVFSSIGSTPSFAVLRSFDDWEARFAAFYVLKPHGAFTQIEGVTDPFPAERPSPIAPIELTLDEVDAVLAYVAAMEAADLGQPLVQQ